jgi:hypothetical protein
MDLAIISLICTGIVSCIQVANFLENRRSKKEDKLNVFAKASDTSDKFTNIEDELKSHVEETDIKINDQVEKMQELSTKHAVLVERVENERNGLEKIEKKIDNILEKL